MLQSAELAIAEYSKIAHSDAPRLTLLKQARAYVSEAEALTGSRAAGDKIREKINAQLDLLLEKRSSPTTVFHQSPGTTRSRI